VVYTLPPLNQCPDDNVADGLGHGLGFLSQRWDSGKLQLDNYCAQALLFHRCIFAVIVVLGRCAI
jgi:hypothetical protein